MIRSLTEIGGHSLATVTDVLQVAQGRDAPLARSLEILSRTVTAKVADRFAAGAQPRFHPVDTVRRERGWRLTDNVEHRLLAATLLGLLVSLDLTHTAASVRAYAAAATQVIDAEQALDDHGSDVERALLIEVLDDALLLSLRRMAQVSAGAPADRVPESTGNEPTRSPGARIKQR